MCRALRQQPRHVVTTWMRGGNMADGRCSIPDCGRKAQARGLCGGHLRRLEKYGDPTAGPPIRGYAKRLPQGAAIEDRFWAKVAIPRDNPLGCWEWTAATNAGNGYGVFQVAPGQRVFAHRLAHELTLGKIDPGMEIDHVCRNRLCVNPVHLQVVTSGENSRRRPDRRVAACPQGHPYSGDNLYEWEGRRYCRTCQRERRQVA